MFVGTASLRSLFLLLLMLLGTAGMWGQSPFILTTASDVENGTEKLYWIESKAAPGFFAISHTNDTDVSTSNMPNERMLWYFMDAGITNDTTFYYIINKSTGKYLKLTGKLGSDRTIQIKDYDSNSDDKFRFSIAGSEGEWVAYPKDGGGNYWANKQGGNVSYSPASGDRAWFKSSNWNSAPDDNSKWNFIAKSSVTWTPPFTISTNEEKHYYLIQNRHNDYRSFYLSNNDSLVTVSNQAFNNRVWYFVEAASVASFPTFKYYYIVNAYTGKYMYFNGDTSGNKISNNAVTMQAHSGGEEARYQFAIVNARGESYYAYSIIPKALIGLYNDKHNSLGLSSLSDGSTVGTLKDRGANVNSAHWTIEPTEYISTCSKPSISYSAATGKVTLSPENEGYTFYYTVDGNNPSSSSTRYEDPFPLSDITRIMAIATKPWMDNSEVASVSVAMSPTINLATTTFTYDGTAKEPEVSNVTNGGDLIDQSEYNVEYSNNTNAGTATVTITDKEGGDYIIYGSTTFTINKANITPEVTIDSWGWNSPASAPSVTGNTGNATVTFEYKEKDAADGTYTETVPNAIGDYTVRATIPATTNYNGATVTADFSITRRRFGDGVRALPGFDIKMTPSGGGYEITVKDGETTLAENTDYEILEEGDYVIVSGIGNYTGSAKFVYASAVFARPGNTGDYAATYCSGLDVELPAGVRPYVVKKVNTSIGTVTVAELSYIPEGVPVLLLSAEELSGFAASPTDESTPAISPSTLSGNLLLTAPGGGVEVKFAEAYVFYKGEFVLTLEGEIGAGRFFFYNPNYTPAPSSGGEARRYLRIVKEEEDATGIDNGEFPILNSQIPVSNEIHNLSGHRVNGPLPRGIYIVNGQKKLIK